jgi:hypothetical protein
MCLPNIKIIPIKTIYEFTKYINNMNNKNHKLFGTYTGINDFFAIQDSIC